jgi:tetratricopeptide (TPR) repeat protein
MIDRMQQLLPDTEWLQTHLEGISPIERQEILLYERSAALCVLLNPKGLQEKASDLFRRLCRYYRARYAAERRILVEKQKTLGLAGRPDYFHDIDRQIGSFLERARVYIDLAYPDAKHFVRLNEEAIIEWERVGSDKEKARELLNESLKRQPRQQRAHYWLSILNHVSESYEAAEDELTKALCEENWEAFKNPEKRLDILYNRACARSRLGERSPETEVQKNYADLATKDLLLACPGPNKMSLKFFLNDTKPGGDLAWLETKKPEDVKRALRRVKGEELASD